jgi:DNA-binding CsgD family transcriptional regulator
MDEARRLQALAAYRARARAFEEIARRRRGPRAPALRQGVAVPAAPVPLSARGRQVLALLAAGYGNKEIAAALQVGAETVKTHVRNVLVALGARNRAHAVAIALRSGLLDAGDRDAGGGSPRSVA